MKRTPLLLFLLFTLSFTSKSQDLILNIGFNLSGINIKYDNLEYNTDNFPLLYADLMINYDYEINSYLSFRPGLGYSRQGKKVVMEVGYGLYYEEKFTINYIEIPLLLTYHFDPESFGGFNFNISLGPYFGLGFRGLVTSFNGAYISEENLYLGEADIKRTDGGYLFVAGFGYDDNQLSFFISGGLKNLAVQGGNYTKFKRISAGINYTRIIDFSENAIRLYKKRLFR